MINLRVSGHLVLLCGIALSLPQSAPALDFFKWGKQKETEIVKVLWETGPQYIAIEAHTGENVSPNQHPAQLDAKTLQQLFYALAARHRSKGVFGIGGKEKDPVPLFTPQMRELLSRHAAAAFAEMRPDQELSFVLFGYYGGRFFSDKKAIGGRMFFLENRLHLLLGDLHRSVRYGATRDLRGFEQEPDLRLHPYKTGRRDLPADGSWSVVLQPGMALHQVGDEERPDWLEIDTSNLALSPIPRERDSAQEAQGLAPAPTQDPVAQATATRELRRLREESRQLKVEFARLRKHIENVEREEDNPRALELLEKRFELLVKLRDKGLISEAEYQEKFSRLLKEI